MLCSARFRSRPRARTEGRPLIRNRPLRVMRPAIFAIASWAGRKRIAIVVAADLNGIGYAVSCLRAHARGGRRADHRAGFRRRCGRIESRSIHCVRVSAIAWRPSGEPMDRRPSLAALRPRGGIGVEQVFQKQRHQHGLAADARLGIDLTELRAHGAWRSAAESSDFGDVAALEREQRDVALSARQ